MRILTRTLPILSLCVLLYQYYIISEQNKEIEQYKMSISEVEYQTKQSEKFLAEIQKEQTRQDEQIKNLQQEYKKIKKKRFLTQDDIKVLERIVEAEAGNQGLTGKIMVSNVILNRLIKGKHTSIKDVVFAKGQFSPVTDGRYYKAKVTNETKKAVDMSLERDYTQGSLYFLNPKVASRSGSSWFRTLIPTTSHSDHLFYR